jgi:hypothetical protein
MHTKPTKEQIESAILSCLSIQALTKRNLLNDVIETLANGHSRRFLSQYGSYTETAKNEFNKEFEPCLMGLAKRKRIWFNRRKKAWFLVG